MFGPIVAAGIAVLVIITLVNTARIVPQKSAYVVERVGKYSRTLKAGHPLARAGVGHERATCGGDAYAI